MGGDLPPVEMTMACCHDDHCADVSPPDHSSRRWALWIALLVNGGFFLTEVIAGIAAGSTALQADALDFFGDAASYAIALSVVGMPLTWRAGAALAKGGTMVLFALAVLVSVAWHAFHGVLPRSPPTPASH
jgi:Co/Zn/Cd efflux system component